MLGAAHADSASASAEHQNDTSVVPCRSGQLRLVASFYGEGLGQFTQTFTLTNVGRVPCRLAGWPGIRLSVGSGRAASVPTIRVVQGSPSAPPFRTVVLDPSGGAASFDLFGGDFNSKADRGCPKTKALFVTPPRASSMPIAVVVPNCGGFYVAPIIAGKTDRNAWSTVWHK